MKHFILTAVLVTAIASVALPAGCSLVNIDEGPTVTSTFDISDFTEIEIGNAFSADISQSDKYSVAITTGEKIAEDLDVSKSGNTLKIKLKEPVINLRTRPAAHITLPDLRSLNIYGAVNGTAKGFKSANDFSLELSGASTLNIDMEVGAFKIEESGASRLSGNLKASSSEINLSGASRISLTGSGGDTKLIVSGASIADLPNYPVGNAKIELSGASQGNLDISGTLDANLSGASRLEYSGNPTLGKLESSGGSSIKPR